MSLLDTLRGGVETANKTTKDIQSTVSYERFLRTDAYGEIVYAPAIPMKAIVDLRRRSVPTASGVLSLSRATITFLDITAVIIATSAEGIDTKDKITMQDGTTGPILNLSGFIDAGTGIPLATEVSLG